MVLDNVIVACTEAAAGTQGTGKRADDHVDEGRVDILVLGETSAGTAEDTVGPGLIEDKAELVAEFEFDLCETRQQAQ